MLSFTTYKLLHLFGIAGLLVALASVCIQAANGFAREQNRFGRVLAIMHGVGSFLILLSACAPLVSKYITRFTPEEIELGAILRPPGFQESPDQPVHWLQSRGPTQLETPGRVFFSG